MNSTRVLPRSCRMPREFESNTLYRHLMAVNLWFKLVSQVRRWRRTLTWCRDSSVNSHHTSKKSNSTRKKLLQRRFIVAYLKSPHLLAYRHLKWLPFLFRSEVAASTRTSHLTSQCWFTVRSSLMCASAQTSACGETRGFTPGTNLTSHLTEH